MVGFASQRRKNQVNTSNGHKQQIACAYTYIPYAYTSAKKAKKKLAYMRSQLPSIEQSRFYFYDTKAAFHWSERKKIEAFYGRHKKTRHVNRLKPLFFSLFASLNKAFSLFTFRSFPVERFNPSICPNTFRTRFEHTCAYLQITHAWCDDNVHFAFYIFGVAVANRNSTLWSPSAWKKLEKFVLQ